MQRWILALVVAACGVLFADNANARPNKPAHPAHPVHPTHPTQGASVPELDPTAAGAALALLLGSAAVVLAGRRRNT